MLQVTAQTLGTSGLFEITLLGEWSLLLVNVDGLKALLLECFRITEQA
jgi:hypothetical protein